MPMAKLFISCTGQCPGFRNNNLTTPGSFGMFSLAVPGVGDVLVLPYMSGYIGMCRCEGYGFQAVYSRIGGIWGVYSSIG